MHKILVHAQDSCACATLLCMHNTLVHAQEPGLGPKKGAGPVPGLGPKKVARVVGEDVPQASKGPSPRQAKKHDIFKKS